MNMDSLSVLFINALAYSVTLLYLFRRKGLSVGLLIWGLFSISSWMSFFLYQQPYFKGTIHDNPQNPMALLYLFVLLLITIGPLFYVDKLKNDIFVLKNERFVLSILVCISLYQIFVFLVDLPKIGNILDSSNLADIRENVYDGNNSNVSKIPLLNRLNLLYSGLKPISVAFSVVLFFCYKKHRGIVWLFLIGNIMSILNEVIVMVSRGIMVGYLIYVGIILFVIREYISNKTKRVLTFYCLPIFALLFSFFWAISVSRFGDLAYYMLYKYSGEAMINFAGILFDDIQGFTYGRGYLLSPIFRDYITCEEKWEFIENVTKIRVSIFYTYIGELVVEFGRFGAVIAACVLYVIQKRIFSKTLSVASLFALFIFVYSFSYGVFVFPIQGFSGFFFVIYTFILYHFFKTKYSR